VHYKSAKYPLDFNTTVHKYDVQMPFLEDALQKQNRTKEVVIAMIWSEIWFKIRHKSEKPKNHKLFLIVSIDVYSTY
jgi:hypothetical protein